ncbi:ATP-grasp domain-containing protein [Kitasatospora phosalacinea]|uniref:ATP-grasp domain-containing protein n=1 Tax=Kitasatospora phosalacinea TaxID=2065 RepID=UPI000527D19A|nr:ATP-grasp domain-containing protein [Kitasatospora phosalacinea]
MVEAAVILPSDPLLPRRVDPHFAWEAGAVRAVGGGHALLDHDALLAGDVESAVRRIPTGPGPLWYRGWMIPTARYAELAEALAARGRPLLAGPDAYATAHELPGWYRTFESVTPASSWLPGTGWDRRALAAAAAELGGRGPAVVKDYVKSRKHEWVEACYVPDLADLDALERVVSRFAELQGEFLAGGLVLRRFEPFVRAADGRAEEARVWWLDGEPVLVGPHPDSPANRVDPDLSEVRPLVRRLGCRFVTTDLARLADAGRWRVVEVGDGQVSELPSGVDVEALFRTLLEA